MQSAILKIMLRRLGVSVPSSSGGSSEEPVVLMQNYTLTNADNGKTFFQNKGDRVVVTIPTLNQGFTCEFVEVAGEGDYSFEFQSVDQNQVLLYPRAYVPRTAGVDSLVRLKLVGDAQANPTMYALTGELMLENPEDSVQTDGNVWLSDDYHNKEIYHTENTPVSVFVQGYLRPDFRCYITQVGTGVVTVEAAEGSGVTVSQRTGKAAATAGPATQIKLISVSGDNYVLTGDLAETEPI